MTRVDVAEAAVSALEPYRAVLHPAQLRDRGEFLAEGRWLVARVLAEPRYRVLSLLLCPGAERALEGPLRRLDPSIPVYCCPTSAFESLTGVRFHQGCLALVKRPDPTAPAQLAQVAKSLLLLEGVANPDNVGALLRCAAAFGLEGVVLGPQCADPFYRKSLRASMGSGLTLAVAQAPSVREWREVLDVRRAGGAPLWVLSPRDATVGLTSLPQPVRGHFALAVGAEGSGVSALLAERASACVRIEMGAGVDSLNVSVAAGIALHWLSARG